jgi:hypothetical protein
VQKNLQSHRRPPESLQEALVMNGESTLSKATSEGILEKNAANTRTFISADIAFIMVPSANTSRELGRAAAKNSEPSLVHQYPPSVINH